MKADHYTILLVDDSLEDRETFKAYLCEDDGCEFSFIETESADEALTTCTRMEVDCVLLDYELPDVDGLEFLERLRSAGRNVPIVMITGRGNEKIAVQALKRGAMDYIVKSDVTPESLYRAMRNAIEKAEYSLEIERERQDKLLAEQELRRSEEQFRFLIESVKDYAIIMLDPDGLVRSWNAGGRRVLDYHDREIIGRHYRAFFTPEDIKARAAETLLERAAREGSVQAERWHVKNGGERFWASEAISPVRDFTGNLKGFAFVLREFPARPGGFDGPTIDLLPRMADAIPAGVLTVLRASGRVLSCNEAGQRLFGSKCPERFENALALGFEDAGRRLLSPRDGRVVNETLRLKRDDGSEVDVVAGGACAARTGRDDVTIIILQKNERKTSTRDGEREIERDRR